MASPDGPTLVVLAAGMSRRYGRLKQLDPVGPSGEAIMDYNVWDAWQAGFGRVILVTREEIEGPVRDHVTSLVGGRIPVSICLQELDLLPDGYRAPPDRRQPWGTAHAVLCAARLLDEPFAVCNADDLYGGHAFTRLASFLGEGPPPPEAAVVGYTLAQTLLGSGRVSRGLCVLGRDRFLERLTEIQDIRMVEGWITGVEAGGEGIELRGHEVVSMNMWAFTPPVVALLRRQFVRFLEAWGASTDAEFRISTAVNGQIRVGQTRCQVLQADDQGFGMTHPDDHDEAVAQVAALVDEGVYPADLGASFRAGRG